MRTFLRRSVDSIFAAGSKTGVLTHESQEHLSWQGLQPLEPRLMLSATLEGGIDILGPTQVEEGQSASYVFDPGNQPIGYWEIDFDGDGIVDAALHAPVIGTGGETIVSSAPTLQWLSQFNAMILGNHQQQYTDFEGRVAVAGNATYTGVGVGQHMQGQPGPALVVGGNLSLSNGQVYGDGVYGGTFGGSSYNFLGGSVSQGTPLDFSAITEQAERDSAYWSELAASGTTSITPWRAITFTGTDSERNVFEIAASELAQATSVLVNAPAGSTVLINVTGNLIAQTSYQMNLQGVNHSQVLWNFVDAQTITLQSTSWQGSIVAPHAAVTYNWAHVNGSVLVKSLTGTVELHHHLFAGQLPGLEVSTGVVYGAVEAGFFYPDGDEPAGRIVSMVVTGYTDDQATEPVISLSHEITVLNVPPDLVITGPLIAETGETYTLDFSSFDPGEDTITHWTIDWGDGTTPQVVQGNPDFATHVYAAAGTFLIRAWATDEDGTWEANAIEVLIDAAEVAVLIENQDLVTEYREELVIPVGEAYLTVHFAQLLFDLASQTGRIDVNDAFEIALLDPATGQSVVATIGTGHDAFFNFTQGLTPYRAPGAFLVDGDGQVVDTVADAGSVVLDISGLAAGRPVELVLRLVNNDTDDTTTVTYLGHEFGLPVGWAAPSGEANPITAVDPAGRPRQAPVWDHLADVTAAFDLTYGSTSFDEATRELVVAISLAKAGALQVRDTLALSIQGIDQPGIDWLNHDGLIPILSGVTTAGTHHLDIGRLLASDASGFFEQDAETGEILLRFRVPEGFNDRFDFRVVVYGAVNVAPVFVSDPFAGPQGQAYVVEHWNTEGQIAARYLEVLAPASGTAQLRYALQGLDPNGDDIHFELLQGPAWLSLVDTDGDGKADTLVGNAGTDQAGVYEVVLRVIDEHGLYDSAADQRFSVRVATASVNRPPQFITPPVVEAYVGQEYVYDAEVFDPDGDTPLPVVGEAYYFDTQGNPVFLDPADFVIGEDGRIRWTAPAHLVDQVVHVTLNTHDGRGGEADQVYRIAVLAVVANRPPYFVTTPVTAASVAQEYRYEVRAVDPDHDELEYSFAPGYTPLPGMSIETVDGRTFVVWTPSAGDANAVLAVALLVSDGRGGTDTQNYNIHVHAEGLGIIRGTKWVDTNGDGIFDEDERGMGGVWVYLDLNNDGELSEGEPVRLTLFDDPSTPDVDESGFYEFEGLPPGTYVVREVIPEGYVQTYPGGVQEATSVVRISEADFVPGSQAIIGFDEFPVGTVITDQYLNDYGVSFGGFFLGQRLGEGSEIPPGAVPTGVVVGLPDGPITIDPNSPAVFITEDGANPTSPVLSGSPMYNGPIAFLFDLPLVSFGIDGGYFDNPQATAITAYGVNGEILGQTVNEDYEIEFLGFASEDGRTPLIKAVLFSVVGEEPAGFAIDNLRFGVDTIPFLSGAHLVQLGHGQVVEDIDFGNMRDPAIPDGDLVILSNPPTTAIVTQPYRYTVRSYSAFQLPVRYELVNGPEGAVLDAESGLLLWDPSLEQVGDFHVTIRAIDSDGRTALQTFDIQSYGLNTAPQIISLPNGPAALGVEWAYSVEAFDANGDELQFALDIRPQGATFDPVTQELRWTPDSHEAGIFRIVVSDGRGGSDFQYFAIPVGGNAAPTLNFGFSTPLIIDQAWSVEILATDPENEALTYALDADALARGMQLVEDAGRWFLTWTPAQLGTFEATVTVTDTPPAGSGASAASVSRTLRLPVNPVPVVHVAPDITSVPTGPAITGESWQYRVEAQHLDGKPLGLEIVDGPRDGAGNLLVTVTPGLEPNTWDLSWTPSEDGSYAFAIRVYEVGNPENHTIQSFTLPAVSDAPPVIAFQARTTVVYGQTFSAQVEAFDPNGDPITFALAFDTTDVPAGMVIDAETGEITWTPTEGQITGLEGTPYRYRVVVTAGPDVVTLSPGGSDWFELRVVEELVNTPPSITSEPSGVADVGKQYVYQAVAHDPDGDAVTWILESGPAGAVLDPVTGRFTWTPTRADLPGPVTVVIRVSDPYGQGEQQTFALPVRAVSPPPEITSTPTGPAVKDRPWQYLVQAQHANGAALAIEIVDGPRDGSGDLLVTAVAGAQPNTWRLSWTPTTGGSYPITVKVYEVDNSANAVTQSFTLPVVSNAPPVIVEAVQRIGAELGEEAVYAISVVDWNLDDVQLSVVSGFGDYTIDEVGFVPSSNDPENPTVFHLRYTPTRLGEQDVVIRVTDSAGASTTHVITLVVHDGTQAPPEVSFQARTTIAFGETFLAQVQASDPNGDPITFALEFDTEDMPAGMSIHAQTGQILWTPTADQVTGADGTPYRYRVIVTAGPDTVTVLPDSGQWFELRVVSQAVNQPPTITSAPSGVANVGKQYVYQATAQDPDGDRLLWLLEQGPRGASIDPDTGRFTWTPTRDDLGGPATVVIRVVDPYGQGERQTFELPVRAINTPPLIVSTPPVQGGDGGEYVYLVRAIDPDGDVLQLSLLLAEDENQDPLTGVIFEQLDATTARLVWSSPEVGTSRFRIEAFDGEDRYVQTFSLVVEEGIVDTPPQFVSQPATSIIAGQSYHYQAEAFDPNGAPTYALDGLSLARGLTIDSVTGVVTWATTLGDLSQPSQAVTVIATQAGVSAYQSFTIHLVDPAQHEPPQIVDPGVLTVAEGGVLTHALVIRDAAGPLTFAVLPDPTDPDAFPEGITIDTTGRILWSAGEIGEHRFVVRVTTPAGSYTEVTLSLSVVADAPPQVELRRLTDIALAGQEVLIEVRATDDIGVVERVLRVKGPGLDPEGVLIPLTMAGVGRFVLPAGSGGQTFTFEAYAVDSSGQRSSVESLAVVVVQPSLFAPVVVATNPYNGSTLQESVDLRGRVYDPDEAGIAWYRVTLTRIDGGTPIVLAEVGQIGGTVDHTVGGPGSTGVLARIDPTILANGTYRVDIEAVDFGGERSSLTGSYTLSIDSELKLGNFQLSFTDMTASVGNVPVTIVRTYDTLDSDRNLDFGHGWSINIEQATVTVENTTWSSVGGYGNYGSLNDFSLIRITLPGGRQEVFQFTPQQQRTGFWTLPYYDPAFTNVSGTGSTLNVSSGTLERDMDGGYLDIFTQYKYNPIATGATLELTTRDGTQYLIDGRSGRIYAITDREGNRVEYSSDATGDLVTAKNRDQVITGQVRIVRDAQDRVTEIIDTADPAGVSIKYTYDAQGNLALVTDRTGRTTSFGYGEDHSGADPGIDVPVHYLTSITDARGVDVLRAVFDPETGRLVGLQDAGGNSAGFSYTLDLGDERTIESVSDAYGNVSEVIRDARGNVLRQVQQTGESAYLVSVFEYDGNNNQTVVWQAFTVVTIAIGRTTSPVQKQSESIYDSHGNQTSVTDANGHITRFENYDSFGNPGVIIDPLGNVTRNTFQNGRLTESTDAAGAKDRYSYDSQGNLTAIRQVREDGLEIVLSTNVYNAQGQLLSTTDVNGVTRTFEYDDQGRQWASQYTSNIGKLIRSETVYDEEGRVLGTQQLVDNQVQWFGSIDYDAAGQVESSTDQFGTISENRYDFQGNLVETRTQTKDENGDLVWLVSRTAYDDNGRAIASTDPFLVDLNGNQITPAADIRVTHTIYDALGRAVESRRIAGVSIDLALETGQTEIYISSFDAGYVSAAILYASYTRYDDQGQVYESESSEGIVTRYGYDDAGRQTHVTIDPDNTYGLNATTTYAYDAGDRQTQATDALGRTTRYEYDALDRVIKTIFADGTSVETVYDHLGHRVAEIDQEGRRTDYHHDDAGRLIGVTLPMIEPDGSATGTVNTDRPHYTYEYDAWGNQTAITDANGNTTRFTYDEFSRQLTRTLPLGVINPGHFSESMEYDPIYGQLIRHFDFEGRVIEYGYDNTAGAGGRLIEKTYRELASGVVVERVRYEYDAFGRVVQVLHDRDDDLLTTADQTITQYGYGADGRQILVSTKSGDAPAKVVNYEFDALGRQTAVFTDQTRTEYAYDELGRLKTVEVYERQNIAFTIPEVTEYQYDILGNLDLVRHSNGVIADYQYDALNRLNLLTHYAPEDGTGDPNTYLDNEVLAAYQYQLSLDGARQQVIEIDDQGRETVITYTYDGLNRLVKEGRDHYDDDLDATTVYILDPTGNRLQKRVDKGRDGTVDETTTYTYDENDRLLTETFESILSIEDRYTVYSYGPTEQTSKEVYEGLDASGTLIEQHTFDYNLQGRQFRATIVRDGTTTVIETQYNDSGIRIKTTESVDSGTPKVTEYVIDSLNHTGYAQVLEEWVGGELVKTYTIGHTMLAQHNDTNGTLTFLADGHGSTRGLTDDLGAVVERYAFDAFGNILTGIGLTAASAALTTHLYAGEKFDHRTGLSFNRARYYDPSIGRFNRLDPWAGNTIDPQSLHKYLYAHTNPVMEIDPSGLFSASIVGVAVNAGIRGGLMGLAIGTPFRAIGLAEDLAEGASLGSAIQNSLIGLAFDATLGAVLGGGSAAALRYAPNLLKLRFAGQAVAGFRSMRLPGSLWNLSFRLRGLGIEKAILNRTASFVGRVIPGFPVIDDFVLRGGQGIATSIKSLDLTARTYQTGSQIVTRLNRYANSLSRFQGASRQGVTIGPGGHPITERLLVIAFEQGAATSVQAQAIARFLGESATRFPNVKVIIQFIP